MAWPRYWRGLFFTNSEATLVTTVGTFTVEHWRWLKQTLAGNRHEAETAVPCYSFNVLLVAANSAAE
jgi:hypothetical protein